MADDITAAELRLCAAMLSDSAVQLEAFSRLDGIDYPAKTFSVTFAIAARSVANLLFEVASRVEHGT